MMSLFKRRFREELHPLLTWGVTLLLTGLALMLLGLVIDTQQLAKDFSDIIQNMPSTIRHMFGGDITTRFSFLYLLGMAFDTIAPILLLIYASLSVLGLYTREASQGNLEFLFSLPVKRIRLIIQRIQVLLLDLVLLQVIFALGLIIGAAVTGLKLDYGSLCWASLDLLLLNFLMSGLAFLLSLTAGDYSRGMLLVMGVLLGLFIVNMGLSEGQSVLSYPNPFHYYNASRIFQEGLVPWRNLLGFALAGLASWWIGIGIYARKQI